LRNFFPGLAERTKEEQWLVTAKIPSKKETDYQRVWNTLLKKTGKCNSRPRKFLKFKTPLKYFKN
jgi:IS30 family transposase